MLFSGLQHVYLLIEGNMNGVQKQLALGFVAAVVTHARAAAACCVLTCCALAVSVHSFHRMNGPFAPIHNGTDLINAVARLTMGTSCIRNRQDAVHGSVKVLIAPTVCDEEGAVWFVKPESAPSRMPCSMARSKTHGRTTLGS